MESPLSKIDEGHKGAWARMLAEKEALLVAEFGVAETATEHDVSRAAQSSPYEPQLVARLKACEMGAFDELVEEYQSLVYALSFRILGDSEDARDATQETFLKVYRHFARFRGEASLKTWICRIAINQARSTERWWRRRQRGKTSSLDAPLGLNKDDDRSVGDLLESDAVSPEADALSRERRRRIEAGLDELKKDFRVAVILRDIEGLSYEEIAYVTEVSVGTVKSRIARGREMLRQAVNAE
jgi:RNA polymerase sigma-70 factor (ECF subfamily)